MRVEEHLALLELVARQQHHIMLLENQNTTLQEKLAELTKEEPAIPETPE